MAVNWHYPAANKHVASFIEGDYLNNLVQQFIDNHKLITSQILTPTQQTGTADKVNCYFMYTYWQQYLK